MLQRIVGLTLVAGLAVSAGCKTTTAPPTTGLTGTVTRSPVVPVCADGMCAAPLASTRFAVERDGHFVAGFTSDDKGHFTVMLAPGPYDVRIDDPSGPVGIIDYPLQVTVAPEGITVVALDWDTGIR